jgi:hypothetical protein
VLRALDAGHAVEAARALAWEVYVRSGILNAPLPQVDAALAACAELCERTGDARASSWLAYTRAEHVVVRLAQPEQALSDLECHMLASDTQSSHQAVSDRAWLNAARSSCLWALGRIAEAGELAHATLEDALARGEHVLVGTVCPMACYAWLAAGYTEQAERLIIESQLRLRAEIKLQDTLWLDARLVVGLYAGRATETWRETAVRRESYLSSWHGRSVLAGAMLSVFAGAAAAAGYAASDLIERRTFLGEARKLAGRVPSSPQLGPHRTPREALIACLDGDRSAAVSALRRCIPAREGELYTQLYRRRLGELLANDEGAALIADADTFLHRAGVIDPARYVAALVPGLELP